jgi:spermidine synthase
MTQTEQTKTATNHSNKFWWAVLILYSLSGLTSLAYEVLWSRMLSMQFGVSIFGVVLTVTAFMLGLGIGSIGGAKWAKLCSKPLMLFAVLEMGIAIYALLLPSIIQTVYEWTESASTNLSVNQWYLLQGTETLCLLIMPAVAMGIGFALMLKVVDQSPVSLAKLYGINTIGGVAGALYPLWSLSEIGWTNSVRLIAMLGLLIGIAALFVARYIRSSKELLSSSENTTYPSIHALLLYGGIGAGSIMLEIGWVRLYGMIMLRTEYVLGVILAVFLLGIALGSILLPRLQKRWMSYALPVAVGSCVLLGIWLLPSASAWVERSQFTSFFGAISSQALLLAIFTLPVTLALGAWLPLLAGQLGGAEKSGVWLYGANCLGGAAGAIIACLIIIPVTGSVAMIIIAGLAITALGFIWLKDRRVWVIFIVMLFAAWPLRNMPPVTELMPKIEANSKDLYRYEDAISISHVVQQQDGQRILLSDLQRMDASSDPSAVEIQKDQARLALLLHPAPHKILFLGLGTGISMAGSLPFPELDRTAVELSQGALIAAKKWFSPVNGNVLDQAQIKRDDARHFLNTTQQKYDVIVGDLFHPDIAGMGSLLSVQEFKRVKNRLSPNGIFVQWIALNQFDVESIKAVLRSFQSVYPEAQMFIDGMHLALVGPEADFHGASVLLQNLQRLSIADQAKATGEEGAWTWLGRYWGPIAATSGTLQDEWVPYIEFKLPRARYEGSVNLITQLQWLLQQHPDPQSAIKILGISEDDKSKFGRAYVATELTTRAWIASMQGNSEKADKLIWLAYQANPQDRWIASALADSMLQSLGQARQRGLSEREALQKVLKIYPNFVNALRSMWHLEQSAGNIQEAERYRLTLLAIAPLDHEAGLSH